MVLKNRKIHKIGTMIYNSLLEGKINYVYADIIGNNDGMIFHLNKNGKLIDIIKYKDSWKDNNIIFHFFEKEGNIKNIIEEGNCDINTFINCKYKEL